MILPTRFPIFPLSRHYQQPGVNARAPMENREEPDLNVATGLALQLQVPEDLLVVPSQKVWIWAIDFRWRQHDELVAV